MQDIALEEPTVVVETATAESVLEWHEPSFLERAASVAVFTWKALLWLLKWAFFIGVVVGFLGAFGFLMACLPIGTIAGYISAVAVMTVIGGTFCLGMVGLEALLVSSGVMQKFLPKIPAWLSSILTGLFASSCVLSGYDCFVNSYVRAENSFWTHDFVRTVGVSLAIFGVFWALRAAPPRGSKWHPIYWSGAVTSVVFASVLLALNAPMIDQVVPPLFALPGMMLLAIGFTVFAGAFIFERPFGNAARPLPKLIPEKRFVRRTRSYFMIGLCAEQIEKARAELMEGYVKEIKQKHPDLVPSTADGTWTWETVAQVLGKGDTLFIKADVQCYEDSVKAAAHLAPDERIALASLRFRARLRHAWRKLKQAVASRIASWTKPASAVAVSPAKAVPETQHVHRVGPMFTMPEAYRDRKVQMVMVGSDKFMLVPVEEEVEAVPEESARPVLTVVTAA